MFAPRAAIGFRWVGMLRMMATATCHGHVPRIDVPQHVAGFARIRGVTLDHEFRRVAISPCNDKSTMNTSLIQVATTTETKADAARIAAALVEQHLAACVQISGPVSSTYRWQGKIETSEEWLCTVKTSANLYQQVEQAIRQLHSYETPEILAIPVTAGSPDYIRWLRDQLQE